MVYSEENLAKVLTWIRNTGSEEEGPSLQSFISKKLVIRDVEGFGRGIYTTDTIEPKELLIRIPHSFLLNTNTVIRHILKYNDTAGPLEFYYNNVYVPYEKRSDKFTEIYGKMAKYELELMSSFQRLSLFICFETQRSDTSFWKPFLDTLPTLDDFESMPLVWQVLDAPKGEQLLKALPRSTQEHSIKTYDRYLTDYRFVRNFIASKLGSIPQYADKDVFQEIDRDLLPRELFLRSWICINSRCLYMKLPQAQNSSDNFTLAPYVDFINHSMNDECILEIRNSGFHVYSTCLYEPGDQIFLSYGPHSNDFLLVEYGFTLSHNKWNDLNITSYILPLLNEEQKEFAEDHNYLGEYTIDNSGNVSFRTEMALAILQEASPKASRKLSAFMNGITDNKCYKEYSDALLLQILRKFLEDCDTREMLTMQLMQSSRIKVTEELSILNKNKRKIADNCLKKIHRLRN